MICRTCLRVLEDAVTDHFPLLVKIETNLCVKNKIKSVWRRNTSKINAHEFESILGLQDWSSIYDIDDPNITLNTMLKNVNLSLDSVATSKEIKIRVNRPTLSLLKDTLSTIDARNKARKSGTVVCD